MKNFFGESKKIEEIFVGCDEKKELTVDINKKMNVSFSLGRGIFTIEIGDGAIKSAGVNITDSLPKGLIASGKFKLSIDNGAKINDYDITKLVVNAATAYARKTRGQ